MHLRDRELQRILQYCKGLGITVNFERYKRGNPAGACWEFEPNPTITVWTFPGLTKTNLILTLLHELGHHLDWIHRGKKDSKKLLEALSRDWYRKPYKDPVLPKSMRRLIYKSEYSGTEYMPIVAKELDLKIPMWKVLAEQAFDRWWYKAYLDRGEYPTETEGKAMRKQLNQEFKEKV